MEETLQIKLAILNKELLSLKTAHRAGARLKVFTFVSDTTTNIYWKNFTIVYDDGPQDIISNIWITNGRLSASNVVNNTQKLFTWTQSAHKTIYITSTRKIISVTPD